MDRSTIELQIEEMSEAQEGLISILETVQAKYSYLPEDALRVVAEKTGHSLVDIYGVATFYKAFSLKPRGKHLISVCLGTACHVRSAPSISQEFQKKLGVRAGDTTEDRLFTLETVNCLGACALGPIVVVDGKYFSNVRPNEVKDIIAKAREGLDAVEISTDERSFPVNVSCPRCNHTLIDADTLVDDLPSIRVVISSARDHGSLRLSAIYGSHNIKSDHELQPNTVVHMFCPHCHVELAGRTDCPKCDAPMVPLTVRGGGMLQICSRYGCPEHQLDLNGVNL